MMDLEVSYAIAKKYLVEVCESSPGRRLVITRAELRDGGWVFYYSSADFIPSRNFLYALGGNLPILVRDDGQVEAIKGSVSELAGQAYHPGDV